MKDYELINVSSALFNQPWAITLDKLADLVAVLGSRKDASAPAIPAADLATERQRAREERAKSIGAKLREVSGMLIDQVGRVAILPFQGTVTQRPSLFSRYSGGVSIEQFAQAHATLVEDTYVKTIVWDIDSPGGSVAGVPEGVARLLAMRGEKKTIALSNTVMASAAYWVGATAEEIVVTPSSLTGSIGVVAVHEDYSRANEKSGVAVKYIHAGKYKVEGNSDEPLSAEGLGALQQTVDDYYALFTKGVAKARGTTDAKVRAGYGEGRVLTAQRAIDAGLADRMATLPEILKKLGAYESGGPFTSETETKVGTRARMYRARQRLAESSLN